MHPSLHPHLHGPKCQEIIILLHQCHNQHPLAKFIGKCNYLTRALDRCLQEEYQERRKKNFEEAKLRRERWKQDARK
ncbi:COX assembly mitochondrial protein 2 homolog [Corticium candelabrum]|uniref:COX assembly mitochondrial protein 2 homolog n=1 Tax=Corticium candelabrum TaxID=121492 RepID=UPI002E261099|nr:COX assembly mitochondrial protein 2 homolog [Corticium candelabrum]